MCYSSIKLIKQGTYKSNGVNVKGFVCYWHTTAVSWNGRKTKMGDEELMILEIFLFAFGEGVYKEVIPKHN